jgi:ParB family transcriptional regulator, chromosome partitioning protein
MSTNNGNKRNALGRGLSALLKDNDTVNNTPTETVSKEVEAVRSINEVLLENIEVNPFQPRTHFDQEALHELADSIKTQGIIQPITVRQLSQDKYQLISGERRYQASKIAGLTSIPAYIRTANDQQMLEMALIENIQRENLNALEVALSYQRMITECNLKQEELGDRVGKNRSTVNNYLRLLKLPPDIQAALRDDEISMGHARALISIDNFGLQLSIFKQLIEQELSVRKLEELVRDAMEGTGKKDASKQAKEKNKDPEIANVQQKLSTHFGTKILIKADNKNKGEIKIPFVSTDDLNRILELLNL